MRGSSSPRWSCCCRGHDSSWTSDGRESNGNPGLLAKLPTRCRGPPVGLAKAVAEGSAWSAVPLFGVAGLDLPVPGN